MYVLKDKDKNIAKAVGIILCLLIGIFFAKIYQPQGKTVKIYQQALKDYQNENYQNSYFLFSKIGFTSSLKPVAIYRQALCAKALGDEKSELKQYQALFHNYPGNELSMEARYFAGQILIDDNPSLALKYFDKVSKSNIDDNYKLASEYYKARILSNKIRYSHGKKNLLYKMKAIKIEESFRKYLKEAPDGRLASNVANTWKKFNPKMNSKDYTLVARAYYLSGMYKEADKIFPKTKLQDSWAIQASNSAKKLDLPKEKVLTEYGISKHSNSVEREDFRRAVNDYIGHSGDDKYKSVSKLFSISKGKGKEYIWNLKCDYAPKTAKYSCYNSMYTNYPSGEFAQTALLNIFFNLIASKDYISARKVGNDFISRFPNSKDIPMMLFWVGKIDQKYDSSSYINDFQQIINKYPDSYYAYRAFWILQRVRTATIPADLEYKPVVYPYRYPMKNDILYSLMSVNDYEMIEKFTKDEFIKSWVEYQQGNYSTSMLTAREAMDKLGKKPVKSDLRWRLVYPQNYYKQVKKSAEEFNNNDALIMALISEESYFDSEAQSGVGAIGLMQLMPATAHDIGAKHDISFNTVDLMNPQLNIVIGNLYYSTLREMLGDKDVSAIAAYNGGVGSVTRWKTTLKYSDTDEFIEQIPYDETRNYVKKVFRSYWNYTRIYQK